MSETSSATSYTSKRDKVGVIHRKVDDLGPQPVAFQKGGDVEFDRAPESGIPYFQYVVAPKPKPAAKKVAAKPKPVLKSKPATKKVAPKKKTLPTDYKGDVHYVVDLEGIGPTYEAKLHAAKIFNTQELLFTGDKRLENITGAPPKTVKNWKDMCQLVKIKGIGPQFAELMVRAGVGGIDEIKTVDPKAGVKQIKDYEATLKTNVTGSGIGIKRMTAWQAIAKSMRKVPIDLTKIEVVGLESRQAIANTAEGETKKPGRGMVAQKPTSSFPLDLAKKAGAKNPRCAAKTAAGKQCSNSARDRSKYCASHKGTRA